MRPPTAGDQRLGLRLARVGLVRAPRQDDGRCQWRAGNRPASHANMDVASRRRLAGGTGGLCVAASGGDHTSWVASEGPRANLVPGSVTGGTGQETDGTVSTAPARTAEDVRSRMSSFQRGVREARSCSADDALLRENLRVVADDRSDQPSQQAKALAVAPARQHWLVADMPTAVPVHEDVSLLVKVGTGPSGTGSGSIPLRDFETGPGGTRVTVTVQAPRKLSPTGPLEQVLVVPKTGDSDPVRFAFRADGLVGIRVAAFAGGTFLHGASSPNCRSRRAAGSSAGRPGRRRRWSRSERYGGGDAAGPVRRRAVHIPTPCRSRTCLSR